MPRSTCLFERRFRGATNAGLRAAIRRRVALVADAACADAVREAVLGLRHCVALAGPGVATLAAVAEDYAARFPQRAENCDCVDCEVCW